MAKKQTFKTKLFNLPVRSISQLRAINFALIFAIAGVIYLIFASAASSYVMTGFEQRHTDLVNQYRNSSGSGSVRRSGCLTRAARAWSQEMAGSNYLKHSDFRNYFARYCPNATNYSFTGQMAENVMMRGPGYSGNRSEGYQAAQDSFNAFRSSPEHNTNQVASRYVVAGFGAAWTADGRTIYTTQIFADCASACRNDTSWWSQPIEVETLQSGAQLQASNADRMDVNRYLNRGGQLKSSNGRYVLVFQSGDGNLVLYDSAQSPVKAVWSTGRGGDKFILQTDQNLVVYSGGSATWNSGTSNRGGYHLVVQNDGKLVLWNRDYSMVIWRS